MKRLALILFILLTSLPQLNAEEIVLIANKHFVPDELELKQIKSLYLGRTKYVSKRKLILIEYDQETSRVEFYKALTGKSLADVDAYWARLRYSGKVTAPRKIKDINQIISLLSKSQAHIAFLPAKDMPAEAENIKVLAIFNKK